MSRQLIVVPNKILRQKCEPIKEITSFVRGLAEDLVAFLDVEHDDEIAVSISAPQLGELVCMFAFRLNPYSTIPSAQVIINPELVYGRKSRTVLETCFSMPDEEFTLQRYQTVKVHGIMLDGSERNFKVHGVVAQAVQHDLNHLDGVLMDELGAKVE